MIKIVKDLLANVRFRLARARIVRLPTTADRFTHIYAKGHWFRNGETRSGAGSTLDATRELRLELPNLLSSLNCKKLLDLGCGDFNWMKQVQLPCEYLGADIVPRMIDSNNQKYASESVRFIVMDGSNDPIPRTIVYPRELE